VPGGLHALGGDVEGALERVNVPSYVIDASGVVRWLNDAACRLVGDVRGRQFTSVVASPDTRRSQEIFARKVAGGVQVTDVEVRLITLDQGDAVVDLSSVPLMGGGRVIGVFGQIVHVETEVPHLAHPHLTARQTEVLRLLEHGRSTAQIAQQLHLSPETVKNHVRHILRALGVHSRLEAVAVARTERLTAA
jgi:PAS domain S-box-containing protein